MFNEYEEVDTMLTKCPECGATVSSEAKVCPKCGAPLLRCPHCKSSNVRALTAEEKHHMKMYDPVAFLSGKYKNNYLCNNCGKYFK